MTGEKIGRLTVIERAKNDKIGNAMWLCRCECGNTVVVRGSNLRNGQTKSCGCIQKETASNRLLKDLVGKRFGKLVVISRSDDYVSPSGGRLVRWLCQCDCGNTAIVNAGTLARGDTKSCGCLRTEFLKEKNLGNFKHGGSHDRLYKVYLNMKSRCYNQNNDSYKYYGGRGIKICDEWLNSYIEFKRWAYSAGYDEDAYHGECTIDRIDVNGNYEPQNCRWVSMAVQCKNKRNVVNKQQNDKCPRKDNA